MITSEDRMKAIIVSMLLCSAAAIGYTGEENPRATAEQTPASTSVPGTGTPPPVLPIPDYKVPTTTIEGPSKPVGFGRLVALGVKPLAARPDGLYSVTYLWHVTPNVDDIVAWPDNTKIWFGTGIANVTYKIELTASYLFTKKTGDTYSEPVNRLTLTEFTVVVQGVAPVPPGPGPGPAPPGPDPPGPGPAPNPTPAPVLPDGKYGFAKDAYTWALDPALVKADAMVRKNNAKALSESFTTVSRQITTAIAAIAAGTTPDIKNATDALAAAKAANNLAVPTARDTWLGWFQSLEAKLKTLKLQNLDELRDAFAELAIGLEAASK